MRKEDSTVDKADNTEGSDCELCDWRNLQYHRDEIQPHNRGDSKSERVGCPARVHFHAYVDEDAPEIRDCHCSIHPAREYHDSDLCRGMLWHCYWRSEAFDHLSNFAQNPPLSWFFTLCPVLTFVFLKSFLGGFGSYLLGLSKKTYELAGVDTVGNSGESYKEPGIGWMVGFHFVVCFVGLFVLIPLRKVCI